ncbi:LysR family transcriptional regulator substrate-binding protein [Paraburkholderia sp. MM5482-R1]|uniref:LysR family transcriptional regulator substrate-binding protein n=1 Tax=unclassified Paraburkholderia TaxID=2615204 RepID=UPI003D1C4D0B
MGLSLWTGSSRTASLMKAFSERFLGIRLRTTKSLSTGLSEQILLGSIDVAVTPSRFVQNDLFRQAVWSEPLRLAVARKRLIGDRIIKAKDLHHVPFIMCSERSSDGLLDACSDYCRSRGFAPDVRYSVDQPDDLMQLSGGRRRSCARP